MSIILNNYLSYDEIKLLNDIAKYDNNMDITHNKIYKYIKDNSAENHLIENDIKLIDTNKKENSQIFEICRGVVDAFIGFTSDKNIIRFDELDTNFQIKSTKIPEIIYDNICDIHNNNNNNNVLEELMVNSNLRYITKRIYKIDFIPRNPYYQLYIKIYYDNSDDIQFEKNIIKQCGFFCKNINLRQFMMNLQI